MLRLLSMLLCLLVLHCGAQADAPATLRACTTEAEAAAFLLLPEEADGVIAPVHAQRGFIRYIGQNEQKDPLFCRAYWCSAEAGSTLDLTAVRSARGKAYREHAGRMCTRAVYAMALSYLGYTETPGDMSVLLQQRSIDAPYDEVTALLPGLERVTYSAHVFETMMHNYLTDESYSPVYLYFRKPGGTYHAILIIGQAQEEGYYLAADPAAHTGDDGQSIRIYRIRFDVHYRRIINSTFRSEHRDSKVITFCQWRRTDSTP